MYEFRQKGRWIYITPSPEGELRRRIIAELSYTRKNSQFMPNPSWGQVKLYQEKRNRFPIGNLERVKRVFYELNINFELYINQLQYNQNHVMVNYILRSYQLKAINQIYEYYGGILSMPTGSGKTKTTLWFLLSEMKPTLIIVPTIDLKIQWEKEIGLYKNMFKVHTYQGLKSKQYIQQFDIVIFDECHLTAAKTLQKIGLNLKESALTIGLSATPMMRDDDNLKVESILGPIIYEIRIRDLINRGFLVDADITFYKYEHDIGDNDTFLDYPEVYSQYIVHNEIRNQIIINKIKELSGYTLVLVDRIDHGKLLESLLTDSDVVFLHGKSKDRTDTNHKIIIATSIFDLGVDIPRLNNLILAGGGESTIKCIQRMGRVLRLYDNKDRAKIFDFYDNYKYLKNHSKKRFEIFTENFKPEVEKYVLP